MMDQIDRKKNSKEIDLNHVHDFSGKTALANNFGCAHYHNVEGSTGKGIPTENGSHVHPVITKTTKTDHYHGVDLFTGPAILGNDGSHRHEIAGKTEAADRHVHMMELYTERYQEQNRPEPCPPEPDPPTPSEEDRCPFPTPNLDCPGFPQFGTCIPAAAGHKPKQSVEQKVERLAENLVSPSVLASVVLETTRRFLAGKVANTPMEADIYTILNGLSPDALDVCQCALNALQAMPSSQRNNVFSPDITPRTELTVENVTRLLADEILNVAGDNLIDFPGSLTNPRPGRVRRDFGTPEFPGTPDPTIFFVNGIRTIQALRITGGQPTIEEVERACTINQQNQQVCTARTQNCPGNATLPPDSVCMLVQHVLPGDVVVLQGANYFRTDAEVVITSSNMPSLRRVVPAIVFGDIDTPVRDEQGNLIDDQRVQDRILFAMPQDLPDGVFSIQVQVRNTDQQLAPVGTFISDPEYVRILPPPNTSYQILAEQLICVGETDGGGSDEVALNFLTSILTLNPETGNIDLSPLTTQEFRFEELDTGDAPRPIGYAPVQASNLLGVNIAIQGYEVDSEEAYREKITELEDAFVRALEGAWSKTASGLTTAVGTAIGVAVAAPLAVAGPIIAAAAAVVGAAVALLVALWAPADPIIEDAIGLTLVDLADLTNNSVPMPPQQVSTTPQGIRVVVDSLSKNVEFRQLRGYFNDDEGSTYQISLRYSRNI